VYLTQLSDSALTVRGVREKNNDACLADDIIKSNGTVGRDKIKVNYLHFCSNDHCGAGRLYVCMCVSVCVSAQPRLNQSINHIFLEWPK